MVMWTTKQNVNNYGWFEDKVCVCNKSNLWHKGYNWDTMNEWKIPPYCADCGKWANRVMKCVKCHDHYYQFFNHPLMGFHSEKVNRGWFCWNCLERYWPIAVEKNPGTRKKVPPPQLVLPPGYELFIDD